MILSSPQTLKCQVCLDRLGPPSPVSVGPRTLPCQSFRLEGWRCTWWMALRLWTVEIWWNPLLELFSGIAKNWSSKLPPNIPIKTSKIKIKTQFQFRLNPLLKSIYDITKNWISKLPPWYSTENINNKNKRKILWDGTLIKNLQLATDFY